MHATHACGVFAAALVSARLLRLGHAQTVDALGIAGSSAGGLLEFLATGSSTKQLHPGLASHAGILAARLAAAGADGPDSVLEGGRGLYAALADGQADAALVTADLGRALGDHRDHAQALPGLPADARRARRRAPDASPDGPLEPGVVASVTVEVHPDSAAIVGEPDKVVPRTAYDAKFSLPWSLAALLIDGQVTLDTYAPDSLARPAGRRPRHPGAGRRGARPAGSPPTPAAGSRSCSSTARCRTGTVERSAAADLSDQARRQRRRRRRPPPTWPLPSTAWPPRRT